VSRDAFLKLAAKIRLIPSSPAFDILTSRVFVRVRTWAGTTEGAEARAGTVTTSDVEILPRPRVRHTSPGSITIGPIQPECAVGGILLSDLLSVKDVKGREGVIFKIIDPLGNTQQYVADDIDGTMALHYTIKASSIGTARTVPNAL
jgi:hypothetical protein